MVRVLITGTSSGIGKETAKLFLDKGYEVYGIDYENRDNINKLCKYPDIIWKCIDKKEEQERISLEKAAAQHHKKKVQKEEEVKQVTSIVVNKAMTISELADKIQKTPADIVNLLFQKLSCSLTVCIFSVNIFTVSFGILYCIESISGFTPLI